MKRSTKVILSLVIILLIAAIAWLGYGYYQKVFVKVQNPIVTIDIADYGQVKLELYPDKAPNTVANFVKLINEGYYNDLTFHRTIPDFMIQGGDKNGDGTGKTDFAIPGEFVANGYTKNDISLSKGTLAMARGDYTSLSPTLKSESYNSAGSQFFIMTKDNTSINGLYAAFGRVIEGQDIVDQIANVEVVTRDSNAETGVDKPVNPPVMTTVTVDTFGVDYGEPQRVEPFDYYSWMMKNYGLDSSQTIVPGE